MAREFQTKEEAEAMLVSLLKAAPFCTGAKSAMAHAARIAEVAGEVRDWRGEVPIGPREGKFALDSMTKVVRAARRLSDCIGEFGGRGRMQTATGSACLCTACGEYVDELDAAIAELDALAKALLQAAVVEAFMARPPPVETMRFAPGTLCPQCHRRMGEHTVDGVRVGEHDFELREPGAIYCPDGRLALQPGESFPKAAP